MRPSDFEALFENIFAGGNPFPDEQGPEPLNKRFSWRDPKTGKPPPKIPRSIRPNKNDLNPDLKCAKCGTPTNEINTDHLPSTSQIIGYCHTCKDKNGSTFVHAGNKQSAEVPIKHIEPSDRVGRYSMNDLLPPGEVASIDHLLDLKLRAQKARGPSRDALSKEFDAHRTEFESLVKKVVNAVLEGSFERMFHKKMGGLRKNIGQINRDLDRMFKELPGGGPSEVPVGDPAARGYTPAMPEEYYDKHLKLIAADRRAHNAVKKYPGDAKRAAAARRTAARLTGHEQRFGSSKGSTA